MPRKFRYVQKAQHPLPKKINMLAFSSKLGRYSLGIREIYADGNCLFRAIADQLEGNQENHMYYRKLAVIHITEKKDFYQNFCWTNIDQYLKKMNKSGEWGGHLEIQALSETLNIPIIIHHLDSIVMVGQARQEIKKNNRLQGCLRLFVHRIKQYTKRVFKVKNSNPPSLRQKNAIHLTYHTGPNIVEHYNSVRIKGDDTNFMAEDVPFPIIEIILQDNKQSPLNLESGSIFDDDFIVE